MKTYTPFDPVTGLLSAWSEIVSDEQAALRSNLIEGHHDCRQFRVRLPVVPGEAPLLDPYRPDPPEGDEWTTWSWDESALRWIPIPSAAAVAEAVRVKRNALLAESDWVTLRAYRTGVAVPAPWADYMQALADVPQQAGFPYSVTWPEKPSE